MVSSTLRAGSEAHTTLGRNSSLTRGHHPHPPSPCSRQRARGGRVSISCAVTYVGNVGKALCAKQPNSRFFCKIPYPSGHQSHPLLPPARGGAAFLFLSLWKKTGGQAPVAVRDWVSIEVHDLAVLSTGHARGLRLGGSPGSPPAAFERSGCALVWSRNVRWSHQRYVRARRPTLR